MSNVNPRPAADEADDTIAWSEARRSAQQKIAAAARPRPRVPSADEEFGHVEEFFGAACTDPPPASAKAQEREAKAYDPESTIAYDYSKEPDEPPVERTKLLEWTSTSPAASPASATTESASYRTTGMPSITVEAVQPIPTSLVTVTVREARTRDRIPTRRVSVPLPLWVHIALASAFVCCVVSIAVLVAVLHAR